MFDPNTRTVEMIEVPVTDLSSSDLLFKLCAQDYFTRSKNKKQIEKISIDADVLCEYTAMLGRVKLTEEQQQTVMLGKAEKSTIHANAPDLLGMNELLSEVDRERKRLEAEMRE